MADKKSNRSSANKRNDLKIKKTMLRVLAVMFGVVFIIMLWQNRIDYCRPRTAAQCAADTIALAGIGKGFPVSVNGSSFEDVAALPSGLLALSDVNLTVYNSTALQYEVRAHYMSSPIMNVSGRYALVYDLGGKKCRIETASKTLVERTVDYVIAGGAVSRTGRYALISYDSEKLTRVDVYTLNGDEIFKWHSENLYFTDVALSPNGQYIAYCGFNAADGKMVSTIMVQRVEYSDTVALIEYTGDHLVALEFLKGGKLAVIGSDSMLIIDRRFESWQEIPYSGELEAYDICYDSGIALYTRAKGAEQGTLSLYDTNGTLRSTCPMSIDSARLSLSSRCCAVFGRGVLDCRGLGGEQLGSCEISPTTLDVLAVDRKVYLLEPSYLRLADYN